MIEVVFVFPSSMGFLSPDTPSKEKVRWQARILDVDLNKHEACILRLRTKMSKYKMGIDVGTSWNLSSLIHFKTPWSVITFHIADVI